MTTTTKEWGRDLDARMAEVINGLNPMSQAEALRAYDRTLNSWRDTAKERDMDRLSSLLLFSAHPAKKEGQQNNKLPIQ